MIITGFGGEIGAGKSTLAHEIERLEPETFLIESWHPIGEVADAFHEHMPAQTGKNEIAWLNRWLKVLPTILSEVVGTESTYSQLRFTQSDVDEDFPKFEKLLLHASNLLKDPDLAMQKITEDNKKTYRPILQWLGGYMVSEVAPTIWYDEIGRRVDAAKQRGAPLAIINGVRYASDFKSVHAIGGVVGRLVRPDLPVKDGNDPTERERNSWRPDFTIINNNEVTDLLDLAPIILEDLKSDSIKPTYITVD